MNEDRLAPEGAIWVCTACGKRSKDLYGDRGSWWDESCMMHAILCEEASIAIDKRGGIISATPYKARVVSVKLNSNDE